MLKEFAEHLMTLAENARENGYTLEAGTVEEMADEALNWNPWRPIGEANKEGQAVLLYSEDLINLDFNPEGVVEGAWMLDEETDEEAWIGAVWDGCHDMWKAQVIHPTHFMPKPVPGGHCDPRI